MGYWTHLFLSNLKRRSLIYRMIWLLPRLSVLWRNADLCVGSLGKCPGKAHGITCTSRAGYRRRTASKTVRGTVNTRQIIHYKCACTARGLCILQPSLGLRHSRLSQWYTQKELKIISRTCILLYMKKVQSSLLFPGTSNSRIFFVIIPLNSLSPDFFLVLPYLFRQNLPKALHFFEKSIIFGFFVHGLFFITFTGVILTRILTFLTLRIHFWVFHVVYMYLTELSKRRENSNILNFT